MSLRRLSSIWRSSKNGAAMHTVVRIMTLLSIVLLAASPKLAGVMTEGCLNPNRRAVSEQVGRRDFEG